VTGDAVALRVPSDRGRGRISPRQGAPAELAGTGDGSDIECQMPHIKYHTSNSKHHT
jgi:hypothetical protein